MDRNTHRYRKKLVSVFDSKPGVRIKCLTSILPTQSDNFVVKYVERKALSQITFEVRLKEVVTLLKKVPGMVKLDAS